MTEPETVRHRPGTVPVVATVIRRSEPFGDMAAAFARAQAKMRHPAASRRNPRFGNTYAALPDVYDAVRDALTGEGIMATMSFDIDGDILYATVLFHLGGTEQWFQSDLSIQLADRNAQTVGSAMTYTERYLTLAACGVATGDYDDDGEAAVIGRSEPGSTVIPIGGRVTPGFARVLRENAAADGASPDDIAGWVSTATDGRTDVLEEVTQGDLGRLRAAKEAWLTDPNRKTSPVRP